MSDFCCGYYPVIEYGDDYLVYTYYHNTIIRIPKGNFNSIAIEDLLENNSLTVKPKNCPGDYSDCVELVISLTNACNLRCKYCFIGEEGPLIKTISEENIDIALYNLAQLATKKNKKTVYIQFFGGEPTLRPDLICYTIKKANELLCGFQIEFGITTNGVFDEEVADLLVSNQFTTTVSMDGLPEFQDNQRIRGNGVGTSVDVERSIRYLTQRGIKVIVRITVTSQMITRFIDIVEYLAALGVKFVHFEPVTKGGRANDALSNINRPDPDLYAEELIQTIEYAKQKGVNILTSTLMNAKSPSLSFCDAVGKNKLCVTYEGLFTSCLGVQSREHPLAKQFIIDRDMTLQDWLDTPFISYVSATDCIHKCKNCFARYVCAGGCPSRNYYANNTIDVIDEMQCVTTRKLLRYYIIKQYDDTVRIQRKENGHGDYQD